MGEVIEPARPEDEAWMRRALEICKTGVDAGQSPFGAAIVRGDELLVADHNHVWLHLDATAHAEVCTIRKACEQLRAIDLSGCTIYSTTEPCPMCFTAIHWAKLDRIVYGASIADADSFGFKELHVSNEQLKTIGGSPVRITPGVLRDEALDLFRYWQGRGGKAY